MHGLSDPKIARYGDEAYPPALKEIPNPPLKFHYRGRLPDPERPHLAIVGTRKATAHGLEIAAHLARELASRGAVIVSGLALGIDTAAHEGALAGKGTTIAVLPVGIDRVYPGHNTGLADQIIHAGGTVISEYDPGTPSYKLHFLERNRIVSGLCRGIIVVEAPEKSGALATAAHALAQNREVFVVPGPISHENYKGSHSLIRAGARLATSAQEILDDLNLAPILPEQSLLPLKEVACNDIQRQIMAVIRSMGTALSIDKIQDFTKMDVSVVTRNLTLLLIQGIVREDGGRYSLIQS